MTVKIYKMSDSVITPKYQTAGSAGFDIHAHLTDDKESTIQLMSDENRATRIVYKADKEGKKTFILPPDHRVLIPTGLKFDCDPEYYVKLYNRSGVAVKNAVMMINNVAIIDQDYVKEVFVCLHNLSGRNFVITDGDRIAQGIVMKRLQGKVVLTVTEPLQKTERDGGFGSTGV